MTTRRAVIDSERTFVHCCARGHGGDFTLPGAEDHYPPDLELEPVHLDVQLQVDVDARRATGTVTHTLRANVDGARTLVLHAVGLENLRVRTDDGEPIVWSYDGREIRIGFERTLQRGEQRRLAVEYVVDRPQTGLFFSSGEAGASRWAATDHETERARYWLPCIDLPSVRPTLAFHIRARSEFEILANGRLIGVDVHGDGTKTAHWQLDQRCPSYLTCFCLGELVRLDDGELDGVPLAYFTTREFDQDHLRRTFGRTRTMMQWMTAKLGMSFPYPKYFQFALPGFGGAMENISLVSWDDVFMLDEPLAAEWERLIDQVNVHEMAHSYFGDLVVCRDFAHAWLKEGWATYMEMCWLEDHLGPDELGLELWFRSRDYFREVHDSYSRPIVTRRFNSSWDLYDMHLYPGGALRLHMLRRELGDAVFWAAVQDYLRIHAGRVVETDDFRRVLEEHSGRSLGRFFDQWLHTAGHPRLHVDFTWDEKTRLGTFDIRQTQAEASDGTPAGTAFVFDLELSWVCGEVLERKTVRVDAAHKRCAFTMTSDPTRVRIDPGFTLVHELEFDPGDTRLAAQLRTADDVIGRIQAGITMIESGRRAGIEAVRAAWPDESCWGVRLEWARALGHCGTPAALELWLEAAEREDDPRVLPGLFRAGSGFRDPRVRALIERRLDAGLGPRARQAAFELLGMQREGAPLERLIDAVADRGIGGFSASGALHGLAASRREEALPALIEATIGDRVARRARPSAAIALGKLTRLLEHRPRERGVERLIDLLRDPDLRVREGAVAGLDAARAGEAVEALDAYGRPLSHQERTRVDRVIARLRDAERRRIKGLEDELEQLRDKQRKLEDRLAKVEARTESG